MKNKILYLIIGILIGVIATTLAFLIYNKTPETNSNEQEMMQMDKWDHNQMYSRDGARQEFGHPIEEKAEKETKASDVNAGREVTESNIDLSRYNSNITITKAGEYTLKREFKNAVLVNSESDVTLILDGVNIENAITAAIVNVGSSELTIKLADNSNNTLSDGGASEYDSCIYSNGKLVIEGNGILNVYGNQEEGEGIATETNDITINGGTIKIESQDDGINAGGDGGIDTDGGFEINGGTVIALGSDMIERPEKTSKQNSVCFELNTKISNGTKVSMKNEFNEEIISFEAKEDFRTLIISNSKLTTGTFYLYENGEKTYYTAQTL